MRAAYGSDGAAAAAGAAAHVVPYAAAAASAGSSGYPGSSLSARVRALHLLDETASSWLRRDDARGGVPDSLRASASVRLWALLPLLEPSLDELDAPAEGSVRPHPMARVQHYTEPMLHMGQQRQAQSSDSAARVGSNVGLIACCSLCAVQAMC